MDTLNERTRLRNDRPSKEGPVLYWMQREQRVQDNWALLYAKEQADLREVPLLVLFNIPPSHRLDTLRIHDFTLKGLKEVELDLKNLNIPFTVLCGKPEQVLVDFILDRKVGEVVGDFNPLNYIDRRKQRVADAISVRYTEVDAHNIIPCWIASDKEEFAAHTFRPKVHRKLSVYLTDIPKIQKHSFSYNKKNNTPDWGELYSIDDIDREVLPVEWLKSGSKAANARLEGFIANELDEYDEKRNDPNANAVSNLSPYLRHGQISAQRVAYEVTKTEASKTSKEAFLEELIVRSELTDNFCFYNKKYNKISGAHAWSQKTIAEQAKVTREYLYSFEQFEKAETHDDLWNAIQSQMVTEGKMHGWCRMYWAKKILEWNPDVQTAIDTALDLNDKYELDGNDPNGVVGVMWSICGVHDRAWGERPVFGKIRYMNYNGAKRKFSIDTYIKKYSGAQSLFID